MKAHLLRLANRVLRPFRVQCLPQAEYEEAARFRMASMLDRLARRNLPVKTVIDLGASDGNWSIACMKYFPTASYLAVEPLEERAEALKAVQQRCGRFDYALCAAGEMDGEEATLNVTQDLDGSTVDGTHPGVPRTCCLRTVDALAAEKNLSGPYLLKFDTHGYELPILAGSSKVLLDTEAIIMELYNFQLTERSLKFYEMCLHLERLGFRPADIADPLLRLHDHAFWQIDMLFLRTASDGFKYPHYR